MPSLARVSLAITLTLFVMAMSPRMTATAEPPAPRAPVAKTSATVAVRLYAMDCGRLEFKDMRAFSDTGEYDGQPGTLAVPCFLIRHPKGALLWEAGLDPKFVQQNQSAMRGISGTLDVPKSGKVLLSGDLYQQRRDRQQKLVSVFNFNRAETLASFDRFERIATNTKARVVIQHDPEDFQSLPKFPAYLE